jgi:hypothetical protein
VKLLAHRLQCQESNSWTCRVHKAVTVVAVAVGAAAAAVVVVVAAAVVVVAAAAVVVVVVVAATEYTPVGLHLSP